jgi:quercetin dioxygenase-like cupin family protein
MVESTKEHFDEIDEIRKTIDFSQFSCKNSCNTTQSRIICKDGSIDMSGLLNKEGISVADCFAVKGTKSPEHTHKEFEILIVYSGKMTFYLKDKKMVICPAQSISIPSEVPHYAFFDEDTHFIAITVPESEFFPEGVC